MRMFSLGSMRFCLLAQACVFPFQVSAQSNRSEADSTMERSGAVLPIVVTSDELSRFPYGTSLGEALVGLVPGATFIQSGHLGGGVSIQLTAPTSASGRNTPLIVLDGAVVRGDREIALLTQDMFTAPTAVMDRLIDIDPKDVELVEIFSPAQGIARFGGEGRSGAIVITTKRGSRGPLSAAVDFSTGFSFNPRRFALNMAPIPGTYDLGIPGQPVQRYDVQDSIFQVGGLTGGRLQISGGFGDLDYFASANFQSTDGTVRTSVAKRMGGRAGVGYRLKDRLSARVTAGFSLGNTAFLEDGARSPVFLTITNPTTYNLFADSITGVYPAGFAGLDLNPLSLIALNSNVFFRDRMDIGFSSSFNVRDNLSLDFSANFDFVNDAISQFTVDDVRDPVGTDSTRIQAFHREMRFGLNHRFLSGTDLVFTTHAGLRLVGERDSAIYSRRIGIDLLPMFELFRRVKPEVRWHWFLSERIDWGERWNFDVDLNYDVHSYLYGSGVQGGFTQVFAQLLPSARARWEAVEDRVHVRAGFRTAFNMTNGILTFAPTVPAERTTEFEVGADFGFSNGVTASLTGYTRKVSGVLVGITAMAPDGSPYQTVGNGVFMSGSGMSASVAGDLVTSSSVVWKVSGNVSWQTQVVDSVDPGYPPFRGPTISSGWALGALWGGAYARDNNGNPVYADSVTPVLKVDTLPDGSFVQSFGLGDPYPDLFLNLSNTILVKENLKIDVRLDGQFGHQVINTARQIGDWIGATKIVETEIAGDTAMGTYAGNVVRRSVTEEFVENADFVKLRHVGVSYRLPEQVAEALGSGADVWFNLAARNLVTVTSYSGLDPEAAMYSSLGVRSAEDYGRTPIRRSIVVGFGIGF